MKKFWEFVKWVLIVLLAVSAFLVPFLIQLHWSYPYKLALEVTPGNHSSWLGFWGSYLGVLPSGVIAAAVAGYQIKAANKQSYQSRQQELIIMRNSKLIDYCYEMKGAVSKSIVVLDSRIQLEARINLEDQCLARYRYEYFVSEDIANIFEDTNYNCLRKSNNDIYFITNVLSNLMKQKMLNEQKKYTENLALLEKFLYSYCKYISGNLLDPEEIEKYPDIKKMKSQLENISDMIDETIEELSA